MNDDHNVLLTFSMSSGKGAELPCSTDTTCWKGAEPSPRPRPNLRRNLRLRSNSCCSTSWKHHRRREEAF